MLPAKRMHTPPAKLNRPAKKKHWTSENMLGTIVAVQDKGCLTNQAVKCLGYHLPLYRTVYQVMFFMVESLDHFHTSDLRKMSWRSMLLNPVKSSMARPVTNSSAQLRRIFYKEGM